MIDMKENIFEEKESDNENGWLGSEIFLDFLDFNRKRFFLWGSVKFRRVLFVVNS